MDSCCNMEESRVQLKVVIVGTVSCGKTALLLQYLSAQFSPGYRATIGVELNVKAAVTENSSIAMQIWDTSGQERFCPAIIPYYRIMNCCVLVFDITNRESFECVDSYRTDCLMGIRSAPNAEQFPFILVGNKADREEEREVTWSEAETWARRHRMPYIEASARDARNVKTVFEEAERMAFTFRNL